MSEDQGCPLCYAAPDEACLTPSGKPRNDHKARQRAASSVSTEPATEAKPRYWLIRYEDWSIPNSIFTDEAAARATYERVSERFNCTLFVEAASSVSAGAGQVPADTIEKAREALQNAFPLVEALPVAGALVEEALDALSRAADSLTQERAALAKADFLMQMPLRYAIKAYEDEPVRTRLLEQYEIVFAALAAVRTPEEKAT